MGELIYRETFDKGPGAWKVGKNHEGGSWHRNVFGHQGEPEPLGWSPTGGRTGGYAYSESPWYFDDNHGLFAWFHLALLVPHSEEAGLAGKDLRDATLKVTLRGRSLELKGTRLWFWIQGRMGRELGRFTYVGDPLYNWALTSQPIERSLRSQEWMEETITLVNDETKWSQMALINGGLARKIRVIQSLTAADGSLANILGGLHFNFGFLLGPLDPNDLPSGRIEMDEISIWVPAR